MAMISVGLAFWWPFFRNSITGLAFAGRANMLLFVCSGLLACVVAALCCGLASRSIAGRVVVVSSCCLASAANALSILLPGMSGLVHVAAVLFAPCYVLLSLAWAMCLHDETAGHGRSLLIALLGSYALSFVIGYLSYLPAPLSLVRPIGAPLISGICWLVCRLGDGAHAVTTGSDRPRRTGVDYGRLYPALIALLVLASIPLAFISGGTASYRPSSLTLVRDTLNIVLIGLLAAVLALSKRPLQSRLPFLLIFSAFTLVGIAVASVLSGDWFMMGIGVMATGKSSLALLLFALVCLDGAPDSEIPKRCVMFFVIPTLGSTLLHAVVVPAVCSALGLAPEGFWGTASLLFAGVLSVCPLVFLSSIAIRSERSGAPLAEGPGSKVRSIELFSTTYGLSERESAVLELLLMGHTFKKIAEIMGLSESTVQSHSKGIYRKAGVHTKQELVDLVYSMSDG